MPGDIIVLHKCTKNHDHMLYCLWDMTRDKFNCYFSFWAIFCPFTPLTAQKIKIKKKKMKKAPIRIIILHMCTKKYDQMMYSSWDIVWDRWMARWTDGKSDIQRWVTHLKTEYLTNGTWLINNSEIVPQRLHLLKL